MYGTQEIYAVMNEQRRIRWGKGVGTLPPQVRDGWGTKWRVTYISEAYKARLTDGTGDVARIVASYEKLSEGHVDLRSVVSCLTGESDRS